MFCVLQKIITKIGPILFVKPIVLALKLYNFLAANFRQPISKNGPKVTIIFENYCYFQKINILASIFVNSVLQKKLTQNFCNYKNSDFLWFNFELKKKDFVETCETQSS